MQNANTEHAVRLSNRQFSLLKMLKGTRGRFFSVEDVAGMNQVTLGSLVGPGRAYLAATKAKDGLVLTPKGDAALRAFEGADFFRRVSSFHFSHFVNLKVPAGEVTERRPQRRRAA